MNGKTEPTDLAQAHGFSPVVGGNARILVLGSMPGLKSLEHQQYYAHPRNAFWLVLAEIFGFDPFLSYANRLARLTAHELALWDVLAQCRRPGSLDSAIEKDSIVCNDFSTFLGKYPGLERICFNGAAAEQLFRRHVLPTLSVQALPELLRLPSTSPANASMTFAEKLRLWREALQK